MPHFQEFTVIVIIFVLIFLSIVKIDQHKKDEDKSRLGIYATVLAVSVALLGYVGYTTIHSEIAVDEFYNNVADTFLSGKMPAIIPDIVAPPSLKN